MKKRTCALLAALGLTVACVGGAMAEERDRVVASSTYGWVLTNATQDENKYVTVEIMEAPNFEKKTYTTAYPMDHHNELTDTYAADSLEKLLMPDVMVEVMRNAAGEVIDYEVVEKIGAPFRGEGNYTYYFDSAEFGGELTAPGGGPGRMVAMGWVLDKDTDARTITIGDGNHVTNVFEQTYTLADDAQIYLVDNSYQVQGENMPGTWAGEEATMDDIMLCPVEGADGKCPGEIYYMRDKYTAVALFDGDYTTYDQGAKVTELYLFKNAYVAKDKELAQPDGMQYNGTSWLPAANKNDEMTGYSFNGSVVPFEIMANRLYFVGDAYTGCYLMIGDDGTMTLLDFGNETATYQYWLNIDKMGYNPREVEHCLLTHGHGDHYQALTEYITMCNRYRLGKGDIGVDEQYQDVVTSGQNATGYGYLGYPELGPELSDNSIRYVLTGWSDWFTWRDLGGGVQVYPFLSVGHSKDSPSFGMLFTATAEDAYFEEGTVVGFVYCGGYGAKSKLSSGYQRLAMNDGLQYIQSVIAPYVDTLCDKLYFLPQHLNQYPLLEVNYCAQQKGIPLMSVYTEGVESIQNAMEKRIAVNYYQSYDDIWHEKTNDVISNLIEPATGWRCSSSGANFETIQKYGPYKRAAGEYELEIESVSIIRGFDAFLNPNDAFEGIKNIYGFDMKDGFLIDKDAYTHDPDHYCVQIVGHVKDDYAGKVDYETNFYGAENYAAAWTSGPVELVNRPEGSDWTEIVRTEMVTKEEAEAMLATVQAGGTYKVNMTLASEIVVAENAADTFAPVAQ